jgi:serine/threonine protein kinase
LPAVKLLDRAVHQRLDRYDLVAELASGGMATVLLGRIVGVGGFQRFVAIKRLHPHLAGDQEFVEMFLDEARIAASIHHPNVVPILEVGTSDRGYYLVMEYVEGDTLARLLARAATVHERIPLPIVIRILLDTLHGLHAAHELRDDNDENLHLVHRDVSPQNILVGIDGSARITDFGVARAATRLSSTRAGQLKGKLAYMAPEQARGGDIDRRADLFALGTVLWEVLADRRLFKGEGEADTLNRVLFEPIPGLLEAAPETPPVLAAITMKALDRDPQKRQRDAAAFADELEDAARSIQAVASHADVAVYVQKMIGREIAQQREAVRAWLAQSEPSRTERGDQGSMVPPTLSSSVSSAAISIAQEPARALARAELLTEITRARKQRNGRLWASLLGLAVVAAAVFVWFSRRGAPFAQHAAAASPASPVPAAAIEPGTSGPTGAAALTSKAAPSASEATLPLPPARAGRSVPVQQLPWAPQPAPVVQTPPPSVQRFPAAPRRTRPSTTASATTPAPAPGEDIPRNPYR